MTLLYPNANTEKPVSGMRPSVWAFGKQGELLTNGFRLRNRPRRDRYRGLLHPSG